MKKQIRRTLCVFTAAAVASSMMMLTGCRNKNTQSGETGNVSVSDETVKAALSYKTAQIKLPKTVDSTAVYYDGNLYAVHNFTITKGDTSEHTVTIVVFDDQGNLVKEIPVGSVSGGNGYLWVNGDIQVDQNGITIMLETMDTETMNSVNELRTIDFDGNIVNSADLSSALSSDEYVSRWVKDKDGDIFLGTYSALIAIDKDGKRLYDIKPEGDPFMTGLFLTNEGVPALSYMSYSADNYSGAIAIVDKEARAVGKKVTVAGEKSWRMQSGTGDYLCYCSGDTGLVGIKADGTVESVLNLLNAGVDNSNLSGFATGGNGEFYITLYSTMMNGNDVVKVYPVEGSENTQKKVITLGCFATDWALRAQVADFNKNSDDYTIYVNSYSDLKDASDTDAAMKNFNNELLAGKVPDILLITSDMPYQSYESKGLFTDMYELIDNDPDLTKDSFLPNVLTAYESDGKLYRLCTSFHVNTYAAKAAKMNGPDMILSDAVTALSSDKDLQIVPYAARNEVLYSAIAYSDFIDYSAKTCNFDNPEFKEILEIAGGYPEDVDFESLARDNPSFYSDYMNTFLEDRCLLYPIMLSDYSDFTWSRAYIGSDYVFTNFPTGKPVSHGLIDSNSVFSIAKNSKNTDGAWEFIKYSLSNVVQQSPYYYFDAEGNYIETSDFKYTTKTNDQPVLKDQFELLKAHACDPQYEYESDGTRKEAEIKTYTMQGEQKLPPLSAHELDLITTVLTETYQIDSLDDEIFKIITDEAAGYYSGTKSADETASLIQNRVNLYMSEHY